MRLQWIHLLAKDKKSEPVKIYDRKTSCGSKYNIYDYYEQAHCHTSQLSQSHYNIFSFSHLSTDISSIHFLSIAALALGPSDNVS